jgi:acetyl-CoA synthetase
MERMQTYEQLYASFRWDIPARYNIAADVCDRHATDPGKVALIGEGPDGKVWQMTFRDIQRKANKLANFLLSIGLVKGDRVMLLLGQNPWTAIGHVACWKAGLVSVPVSVLFAADAVAFRLGHVAARVVITDLANLPTAVRAREQATEAVRIFVIDGREPEAESLPDAIEPARDTFTNVDTAADDPAFLNFTSGTTGNPKGALQAHRSMLGHLPGAEFCLDFFPQPHDLMWSPADWSWLAGLMDVLMPAWYHGVPVLTFRAARFDPEQAFAMIGRHRVRTALLVPTMLRLMRQVPDPVGRFGVDLRAIYSVASRSAKNCSSGALRCSRCRSTKCSARPSATSCSVRMRASCRSSPVRWDGRYPDMSPPSSTTPARPCRPALSAISLFGGRIR